MSQEEEKLIEEFKQKAGNYIVVGREPDEYFEDESEFTLDKIPQDCMDFILSCLNEAYRSGKLAELNILENNLELSVISRKEERWNCPRKGNCLCDECTMIAGFNKGISKAGHLIEEEKKKL